MLNGEIYNNHPSFVLFPVRQKDNSLVYYASDYAEGLGSSVYKGYQCELLTTKAVLMPMRVDKTEIVLNKTKPVAIKFYEAGTHPSPYQFYDSEIAVLKLEEKDVLIMEYIDGFHIYATGNPQLKQLNFFQIVDIAWQLIQDLNRRHYNNTHGPAVVHGDIKGSNIKIRITAVNGNKPDKIDVLCLDDDYAKPITNTPQCPQGTLEHCAIEILSGYYSESSDFFALTPLLLSLFGADNPWQKILAFRNAHPSMAQALLVKQYSKLGFSSVGLFAHFDKKPEPAICELIKNFIMQMGAKLKQDRPTPAAILEFFTALRQLCLLDDTNENRDFYILRLKIAAQDKSWLTKKNYPMLLMSLEENLQDRLISLMNADQRTSLHKILLATKINTPLIAKLKKSIVVHPKHLSESIKSTSKFCSSFFPTVTATELQCSSQEGIEIEKINGNKPIIQIS